MKPSPRAVVPVIVIGLIVAGYFVDAARAKKSSTLSGFFESQPTKIASRAPGRVAEILVNEGDMVRKGQKLLILEADTTAEDAASKEALAVQASEALAEQVNGSRIEDIRRQAATVAEYEADLQKLRNGSRPEEIREAREHARQAREMYDKALAGSRPEEIAQARAAAREAHARLAQAIRGLTAEEKAEASDRYAAAKAQEELAASDFARTERLYEEGAVSRRDYDTAQAALKTAKAQTAEAEQADRRAQLGTPPEEMAQARASDRQAQAALQLLLAGTRKEDIAAARADYEAAEQELILAVKGPRTEDIEAASARLAQATNELTLLRNGSRKEVIAQAKAASIAAKLQARSALSALSERVVVAPCDGLIERIPVSKGDLLQADSTLIQMTDPADIWLRVYVPERELEMIKVNDDAYLAVDGIDGLLKGYVESISTSGEFTPANLQTPDERGKQVFGIRIRLRQPDMRVKAGMYVTVRQVGRRR